MAGRPSRESEKARAAAVFDALHAAMPDARIELDHQTPLELLVAVILSAQCTDARVNTVTPKLFADHRTAADYARRTPLEIEGYIASLGLFRNKAKALVAMGQQLQDQHGGVVPTTRDALAELPGVGLKTAGVVAMHLGGTPAFPVDTHVGRLSRRLGFTKAEDPDDVEADLQRLVPVERWFLGHQLLVWHGRRVCFARSPACERCPVADLCPKKGL